MTDVLQYDTSYAWIKANYGLYDGVDLSFSGFGFRQDFLFSNY